MEIAVVGAGFSGLLVTLHLLRLGAAHRIVLLEQASSFGRGLAYGAADPDHLLNVRATNMSAYPDDPQHFLRWLAAEQAATAQEGFVPRRVFGHYLQALLREAVSAASGHGRLSLVADEVVALASEGQRSTLRLAMGRTISVDRVVLAIGNLPPHQPAGMPREVLESPRYVRDPWTPGALDRVRSDDDVLLLGSGLTAVDIALKLASRTKGVTITALSRRGLRPRAHRDGLPPAAAYDIPSRPRASDLVRLVRARCGDDWRAAVDGLRSGTQRLWQEADPDERQRFLRHLRPWWDVHRHRLAPAVAARLDALEASGGFVVRGGAIRSFRTADDAIAVDWRPRRTSTFQVLRVAHVVNCTGPAGDLAASRSPLLADLVNHGIARADACRLGLDVDAECRVLGVDGQPNPHLFAVGPISRGAFWEITAVPDIRVQAAAFAARMAAKS